MTTYEVPRLPYDIMENIVHCARDDQSVLQILMNTSNALSSLSRRYIYSKVEITTVVGSRDGRPTSGFHYLLVHCPYVIPYIRELVIYFGFKRHFSNTYLKALAFILDSTAYLEHLCLSELMESPSPLFIAIQKALQRPSLIKLSIQSSDISLSTLLDVPTQITAFCIGHNRTIPGSLPHRNSPPIPLTTLAWSGGNDQNIMDPFARLYMDPQSPFDLSNLQTLIWGYTCTFPHHYFQGLRNILQFTTRSLQNLHLTCPDISRRGFPRQESLVLTDSMLQVDLSCLTSLHSLTVVLGNHTRDTYTCTMRWLTGVLCTTNLIEVFTLKFVFPVDAEDINIYPQHLTPVLKSYPRLRIFRIDCDGVRSVEQCRRLIRDSEMSSLLERVTVDIFVGAEHIE